MKSFFTKLVSVVVIVFLFRSLGAQQSYLDPTFGINGVAILSTGVDTSFAESVCIQQDGKIVVAGVSGTGNNSDIVLARYLSTGLLDATFGTNGVVITDISGTEDRASEVVEQSDGKLLVIGTSEVGSTYPSFMLARYNTDGSLDASFGNTGITTTTITTFYNVPNSVAFQSDGKVLVCGFAGLQFELAIARYNTDGTLDATFGNNGTVEADFETGYDIGGGIVVLADDKIVVGGTANNDYLIARYSSDGVLDNAFGTNGYTTTDVVGNSLADNGWGLVMQTDGKLLVSGYAYRGIDNDFATVRYLSDGSTDNSYATNGKGIFDLSNEHDKCWASTIQSDNKMVLVGDSDDGTSKLAIARVNDTGELDISFGNGGKVVEAVNGHISSGIDVAIQTDGKVVVAGYVNDGSHNELMVARYLGDNGVSGLEQKTNDSFSLFPNPTNGDFQIDLGKIVEEIEIVISDSYGKLLLTKQFNKRQTISIPLNYTNGVYFVKVRAGNEFEVKQVVKY